MKTKGIFMTGMVKKVCLEEVEVIMTTLAAAASHSEILRMSSGSSLVEGIHSHISSLMTHSTTSLEEVTVATQG